MSDSKRREIINLLKNGKMTAGDIIAMCVTLAVSLILPVVVLIVYGVKSKGEGVWSAWFLGAAGFFVMQIVIRIPILSLLTSNKGVIDFVGNHYVL